MVSGLSPKLQNSHGFVSIQGSSGQGSQQVGLADMVGTRASDQDSARPQHLEGAEVEFLVAAECGIEVAFRFGEGGRVENDGVVLVAGGGVVLEQVEGVGFDPFDFRLGRLAAVEDGVLIGGRELSAAVT